MAHWHDFNPWAAYCLYLSYEEMRELLGATYPDERLAAYGSKLDAYILPQGKDMVRQYSFGIRYGREGGDYLSPPITNEQGWKIEEKRALLGPELGVN